MSDTTIRVSYANRQRLKDKKIHKREKIDDVVSRLLGVPVA